MNQRNQAAAIFVCVLLLLSALVPTVFAAVPEGNAVLGDRVWLDADADGIQDSGEAGINEVRVNLYFDSNQNGVIDPGEFVSFTTTANKPATTNPGWYNFAVDSGKQYIVEIDASNFAAGGKLEGKVQTSGATIGPNPLVVAPLDVAEDYQDADFGYVNTPFTVTKVRLNTDLYVASGATVVFRITVANTGPQTLSPVPLDDFFNPACLKYVSASITPDVVDAALGRLHWNNFGLVANGPVVHRGRYLHGPDNHGDGLEGRRLAGLRAEGHSRLRRETSRLGQPAEQRKRLVPSRTRRDGQLALVV